MSDTSAPVGDVFTKGRPVMLRTIRGLSHLVLLAGLWSLSALAQEGGTIFIGIGGQKAMDFPGMTRVAVSDPKVFDVKTLGGAQLLITANGEGKASLIVWKGAQKMNYTVVVKTNDPVQIVKEIKSLIGEIEGVTVRNVGDRYYLEGQAYTQADFDRINQVVKLYEGVGAVTFVRVAPNAKKLVAQNLNAAFQKSGLKNVNASVIGATIFLEGSVESQQDLQKAEMITKAIGEQAENLLTVGIKRMVLTEVQFVEVRRSSRDRYGIKYPTDITGTVSGGITLTKDLVAGGPFTADLGINAPLRADVALGFQNNDGYNRLLAQPKLVCASGEQAEFMAGGEVPIPLITNNTFAVEFKPYGVILKIHPTADRNGNIQTQIEAEVSAVDQTVAVSVGANVAVPGFRTRKVKTNVTVRHGETIVLSGVFSNDEQKSVSKLPGFGHIPIIGELFKNRAFDSGKTDLMIFVTPRIVNPESDRIRTLIEDIKSQYRQARGEVNFGIFD